MTRPLRIEYPGALYHTMSHGDNYHDLFIDNRDRRAFLENLEHCIEVHNLICHAYSLMCNHYHLLIETPDGNLSAAMRDINGNYTQRFNTRHKCKGHLLQGRYRAFLVEKELYLLEVARYIVNNPVSAGLVEHPKYCEWSNYKATAGLMEAPEWLEIDFTLGLFSKNIKDSQKQYCNFVKDGLDEDSPYDKIKEGTILGSPQFIDWIWGKFSNVEKVKEVTVSNRMIGRPSLEDMFSEIENRINRDKMIYIARHRAAYTVTEIANYLGLHRSTVSKILNKR